MTGIYETDKGQRGDLALTFLNLVLKYDKQNLVDQLCLQISLTNLLHTLMILKCYVTKSRRGGRSIGLTERKSQK